MKSYDLENFSLQKQFEFHKIIKIIEEIDDLNEAKIIAKEFLYLYMNTQNAVNALISWDINKK